MVLQKRCWSLPERTARPSPVFRGCCGPATCLPAPCTLSACSKVLQLGGCPLSPPPPRSMFPAMHPAHHCGGAPKRPSPKRPVAARCLAFLPPSGMPRPATRSRVPGKDRLRGTLTALSTLHCPQEVNTASPMGTRQPLHLSDQRPPARSGTAETVQLCLAWAA